MKNMRTNNNRGGFRGRSSGNRFGGRSSGFGGGSGGRNHFRKGRDGARSERRTEMHDAICSNCGKQCQVPFRPTGTKPVLCSDCFRNDGDSGNNFGTRTSGGASASSDEFTQINAKLDRILRVLQELEIDIEEDMENDEDEELDDDEDDEETKN